MIACVHLPRFALTVAAGIQEPGSPLAIAPASDPQHVGEASGAAQAAGVTAGLGIGEALARCPTLKLVPEDPVAVEKAWERTLRALEGTGAQVEAPRPGLAYFDANSLLGLYRDREGVIAAARRALDRPVRIGVAPSRFCALAAALSARPRRATLIDTRQARRFLAEQPVGLLAYRAQTAAIAPVLERFGVETLGDLPKLGASDLADRFGHAGTAALRLALGHDAPLRPRQVEDRLQETMSLGETASTLALSRTLGVLVNRLLARQQRRGRTIRAVTLSAKLVERGTWSETVVLREATADASRITLAVSARLPLLPAPAETLTLSVLAFGPAGGEQQSLLDHSRQARLDALRDAIGQVRTLAGPNAAVKPLLVDPKSRVPERRYVFTPHTP